MEIYESRGADGSPLLNWMSIDVYLPCMDGGDALISEARRIVSCFPVNDLVAAPVTFTQD